MQVADLHLVPLLVKASGYAHAGPTEPVLDDFVAGLAVVYALGPPFGKRLLSQRGLSELGWSRQLLRTRAAEALDHQRDAVRIYGKPPALMLSFGGLESSLLLASRIWSDLERVVPGEIVVGVPARDVVIVTGSRSPSGLARLRRAVDRMFFARQRHPLSGRLLVRRGGAWTALSGRPAPPRAAPPRAAPPRPA